MAVTPATAAEWHELGINQEQQGHLEAAAESYRVALQVGGPDPQICFDLAHVLAQSGQRQAAVERYMQAVELLRRARDCGQPDAGARVKQRAESAKPTHTGSGSDR